MCPNETVEMNRELPSSCHPEVDQDGLVLLVAVHSAANHHSGLGASENKTWGTPGRNGRDEPGAADLPPKGQSRCMRSKNATDSNAPKVIQNCPEQSQGDYVLSP